MEFRPEASGAEISDASCEGGTIVYNGNSGDAIWDKKRRISLSATSNSGMKTSKA